MNKTTPQKHWYKKLTLSSKNERVVFLNGALIMVLEIIGARVITPYVGSSSFVWTAIIGVMLAALAAGYAWGGKRADTQKASDLAPIFALSSALVLAAVLLYPLLLPNIAETLKDVRVIAVVSAAVLFAPAAFFMGSVSPFVAARHTVSLKKAGSTIGSIYAYGTAGSIVGTFISGFILTSYFTNRSILLGIAVLLLALAVYENPGRLKKQYIAGSVIVTMLLGLINVPFDQNAIYEKDTPYGHYTVIDTALQGEPARVLATDAFAWQTGVLINRPTTPAFPYIDAFRKVLASKENVKDVLLLGGGTFSFPLIVSEQFPGVRMDVVEIDGELLEIAETYFNYTEKPNITIHIADARAYMERVDKKYDIIFVDVFSGMHPPFHLTTQEFVQLSRERLKDNGIVAANIIGSFDGPNASFAASQVATYSLDFERVTTYPVRAASKATRENILLIATKGEDNDRYSRYPAKTVTGKKLIFTDEYAPVDRTIGRVSY